MTLLDLIILYTFNEINYIILFFTRRLLYLLTLWFKNLAFNVWSYLQTSEIAKSWTQNELNLKNEATVNAWMNTFTRSVSYKKSKPMNKNYTKIVSKLCWIYILKKFCILIVFVFFHKRLNEFSRNSFEKLIVQLGEKKKVSWAKRYCW